MVRQRATALTTTITCKERRSHDFGYCSVADPDDDADEHARILSDITIATRIKQNCRERERERETHEDGEHEDGHHDQHVGVEGP